MACWIDIFDIGVRIDLIAHFDMIRPHSTTETTMAFHPAPERLEAFVQGRVGPDEVGGIVAHLEDCPDCCNLLEHIDDDPFITRLRAAGSTRLPRIAGYDVLEEIGRGGMGVVYRARQRSLNRLVALKVLLAGSWAGADDRRRFRAEADALSRVRHPAVVPVHDAGEHDGLPYLIMELVEGGSLAQRLARGPMTPYDAAVLLERLAEGVAAVHALGIIHRDLKPANVLLGDVPKVVDFGLAKWDGRDQIATKTGIIAGTPPYMAPEQAAGNKEFGAATDVYALGAILYECLTGVPPFQADSAMETLHQVLKHPPIAPRRRRSGVPADLEAVCLRCLEKDPAHRYCGAAELAADLRRFLAGEPTQTRPQTRKVPVLAISVIGVLLILVGGLWRGSPKQSRDEDPDPPEFALAGRRQTDAAERLGVPVEVRNPLGMRFRLLPPGEVVFGESPEFLSRLARSQPTFTELYKTIEHPRVIRLTRPLYMSVFEVTISQCAELKFEGRTSEFCPGGRFAERASGLDTRMWPAEVSPHQAFRLCNLLSEREGLTPRYEQIMGEWKLRSGSGYRLPTLAEWQYATRSGATVPYVVGTQFKALQPYAWVATNSDARPRPVGTKRPNGFGLYDTIGNALEVCHSQGTGDEASAMRDGESLLTELQMCGSYWWGRDYEAFVAFHAIATSQSHGVGVRPVRDLP